MEETVMASFDSAKASVNLAIGLIGIMAFWLGLTKIAEAAGLMNAIARAIKPVMVRLFPGVPADHPAMSAMIMNFAANAIGLTNAATPLGIKAMMELDKLNTEKGTATNAMCLFLAINTSNIAILPTGAIGVRAAAGAANPAAIIPTTFIATLLSTITAITIAKFFEARHKQTPGTVAPVSDESTEAPAHQGQQRDEPALTPPSTVAKTIALMTVFGFASSIVYQIVTGDNAGEFGVELYSFWLLPVIIGTLLLYGYFKGVNVYETAIEGARDGFETAKRIIPYLVAILVAIGMFKASGAFDLLEMAVKPFTNLIGMPAEALPMALMRPLSGSGAFGIMAEVVNSAPDSFASYVVSTMQGSTETTFYVLAVYFGAVGVSRSRHALHTALTADAVGALASVLICRLLW
ncbi:MAG: spore maturation protein [Chitinivibrionales bacterium]|nr:spore maturation protein [Chitinivibrionales bacterium]